MIRMFPILMILATPALSQMQPIPRPDDLGQRRTEVVAETVTDATTPDRAAVAAQITGAIRNCWTVGDLSEDAMAVRIWVAFNTTPAGEVIRDTIEMVEFSNGTQDAADEALGPALRAILRCAALGLDLPSDTFPIWQRVEVQFHALSVVTL